MTDSIFDSHQFLQSLAGDEELAHELLGAFMEDSPERKKALAQALDENDAEKASKLAHSLKGMCGVVRAKPLVDVALLMENSARENDLETTKTHFSEFTVKLDKAHEEMKTFSQG
ncbi:Hpt domain-containing protein [Pseudodesulfovibrio piezophilus]|uniref:Hpt protein n=1 Tax=Pseudodesulfovibrio piezophilus (strain DSM 21447 / JCM 15486 / C1TLV30) TaxID=1322246 RepID=M1WRM3_PSEP2|nr:Hpt domain-containing protein [Pseudodesulfovibrio piezophilus]CCH49649.1 Hpt protein [Pseudodesulfovibrio piezophilus C1TLV30]